MKDREHHITFTKTVSKNDFQARSVPGLPANTGFTSNANIQFQEISPQQAFEKASKEKRLVFAYFYSPELPVCAILEEKSFQDEGLMSVLDSNFITVRIEVGSDLFSQWEAVFDITSVPTCLLSNEKGNLLEIIEGAYSAAGFLHKINRAQYKNNFLATFKPIKNQIVPDADVLATFDFTSAFMLAELTDTIIDANENLNEGFYMNFFYLASDEIAELEEAPPFEIQAQQRTPDVFKPKGKINLVESYHIQVGIFKDHQNALNLRKALKNKLEKDVELEEVYIKQKPYYRVLCGRNLSKSAAILQVKRLKKMGFESFIRTDRKKIVFALLRKQVYYTFKV